MNKNALFRAAAALSISATLLWSGVSCGMSELINVPLPTYTIEHSEIENYISVSGTVEGSNIVKITSDVTAKVKTLNVEIGSSVKEGDVLCVFDSSSYQEQYDKLKANADISSERLNSIHEKNRRALEEAKEEKAAELKQAQRAIDSAVSARDRAYARYDEAYNSMNGYYAQYSSFYDAGEYDMAASYLSMYEAAKSEYEVLGDQLSSFDTAVQDAKDAYTAVEKRADAAIQAVQDIINDEKYDVDTTIQDELDKLKETIDKCVVKAPRSGIITALNIAEGSFPTTDALMTIEDTSQLRINVTINEADILNVHEGQETIITTTATGKEEFSGTVSRVVNIMSGQSQNMFTGESTGGGYSAEITIDKGAENLLIGMSAKAKIILDRKENVIAVPYDAIVENEDGSFSVFVAEKTDKGHTAKEVKVEKGLETNYLSEVISSELKDGDTVITIAAALSDGDPVTIEEGYTDPNEADGE